jgi:predicted alpha/beta superfamily hydrolase
MFSNQIDDECSGRAWRRAIQTVLPAFMLLLACPTIIAAEIQRFELPNTRVHQLSSEFSDVEYEIRVWLPRSYAEGRRVYPLMIMLDADYSFPLVTSIADHLAERGQSMDYVIAAIAYRNSGDSPYWYRRNRTRDYTPTDTPEGGYSREIQQFSGGGPEFLRFIGEQLLPYLNSRYRVGNDDRVFVGHSFGGLFGAYVLTENPELFRRYILVSPSLWYDDYMMLQPARLNRLSTINNAKELFMAVGAHENQSGQRMVDDLENYVSSIDKLENPNLFIEQRVFDGETHASIFPIALSTALRYFFSLEQD